MSSPVSSDVVVLRREDLAGLVTSYRGAVRGKKEFALFCASLSGFAVGPLLMLARSRAGWPEVLDMYFFFLSWAIVLSFGAVLLVRARRFRARYEIRCPACDVSLLGPASKNGSIAPMYAEMAIATGCCPSCGARILAP
ncbi:MAG: hypothetical protein ACHQRL_08520 [Gemmatimonadales bacterium]